MATPRDLAPAINGTEQRLDVLIQQQQALLDELRALKQLLAPRTSLVPEGLVELREPEKPRRMRKRG